MAPLRLRHPKGVSTIDIDLDSSLTVQDLQQHIYKATDILPSRQTRQLFHYVQVIIYGP